MLTPINIAVSIFVIGILIFIYIWLKNAGLFKKCPEGSFMHQLSGQCYTCPEGYIRSLNPDINAPNACVKPCPEGGFEHWLSGQCYKCPDGFTRSLNPDINAKDACVSLLPCNRKYPGEVRNGKEYGPAFEHWLSGECYACPKGFSRTINPDPKSKDACIDNRGCAVAFPGGSVRDERNNLLQGPSFEHLGLLTRTCYSCPEGFDRTVAPIDAGDACLMNLSCPQKWGKDDKWTDGSLKGLSPSFEHLLTRQCYSCPEGFNRSLNPNINGEDACISQKSCPEMYGATNEYEPSFEHWFSGQCFSCPKGYSRTLSSIDANDACGKGFLGLGGVSKAFPRGKRIHSAVQRGSRISNTMQRGSLIAPGLDVGKVQAFATPLGSNIKGAIYVGPAE